MKKLALLLVCLAALLPASLSAGCFSFNVFFNAASLLFPPCPRPVIVERHYCPPPVCYYGPVVHAWRPAPVMIEKRVVYPYYPY